MSRTTKFYQNIIYKAATIAVSIIAPILKGILVWNNPLCNSIPLGSSVFLSSTLIKIAIPDNTRKTTPILSRNGSEDHKTLKANESGIVSTATESAAFAVIRFQNNPKQKITTTPGVTNPVNS